MAFLIETLNFWLSLGTIVLQLAILGLLYLYFFSKNEILKKRVYAFGLPLALALVLGGIGLTLVYSELFGFEPCGLCWLQRVFLYPQAVLLALALWKHEHRHVADYCIGLSVIGAVVALYQHYLQMGGTELVTCPTVSTGAECSSRFLFEFGYITFPLMSATLFIFIIALMLFLRRSY